ncbi:4527_t:CDS:2 [Entrophospora sp. SA101]|nr:4527_t:CDS:2 [Entrophospora sp. SA101]
MPTRNLTNITIKKLEDKNLNTYYLIVNNDNQDEAYFCFEKTVKEENIREVEIEFEEINKVINSAEQKEIQSIVGDQNNFKTYRKVVSFYSPQTEEFIV